MQALVKPGNLRAAAGSQARTIAGTASSPKDPPVILEIADIRVHPGQGDAFADAIQRGLATVIARAEGFQGFKVNRGIENPERFVLQIFWATLEDHTVRFRGGPLFAEWRAIVGPFFAAPPVVEHFTLVAKSA
jgi:heme-degrading monooxygenase HmoA